jgi:cell volume regulation protein A
VLALASAGVIYGVTALAHGSGFLAVFVAGILFGDTRAPYKGEIERFQKSLANLAEIAMFVVLGLTISLDRFADDGVWLDALILALVLVLVARPLAVGLLTLPMRFRWGERVFLVWSGLRGAVPILLGTLALLEGIGDAERVYHIIFVVVLLSVLVQGTSIPYVAGRLDIRMREADPAGLVRRSVAEGSPAIGQTLRSLPLGERTWVRSVTRDGRAVRPRGVTVLEAGDELELILDVSDVNRIAKLFGSPSAPDEEERRDGAGVAGDEQSAAAPPEHAP